MQFSFTVPSSFSKITVYEEKNDKEIDEIKNRIDETAFQYDEIMKSIDHLIEQKNSLQNQDDSKESLINEDFLIKIEEEEEENDIIQFHLSSEIIQIHIHQLCKYSHLIQKEFPRPINVGEVAESIDSYLEVFGKQNKKKILVVDDSELNRSLLADMLSDDFEIIEAENGVEAVNIMSERELEISLMLLDIVMPVMDGFEVLSMMNHTGWIKMIPVIMISAETVPTYVERAYDLGVLDFINRPFDVRIVQRRVASAIMLVAKRNELAQMVVNQVYEKEKDSRLMIEILSNLVEFRNGDSGLHVLHIQVFTEQLLKRLLVKTDRYPMNHRDISFICNAAALHDIGKIAVPPEILNKPGRLTPEEFEVMKSHTTQGCELLENIPELRECEAFPLICDVCRHHHERWDGSGYPDRLAGDSITPWVQVVGLADAFDALIHPRVYKPAYPQDQASDMIVSGACGIFDPLLLACFARHIGMIAQAVYN